MIDEMLKRMTIKNAAEAPQVSLESVVAAMASVVSNRGDLSFSELTEKVVEKMGCG